MNHTPEGFQLVSWLLVVFGSLWLDYVMFSKIFLGIFWVSGSWLCLGLSAKGGGTLWAEWGPGSGTSSSCTLRITTFLLKYKYIKIQIHYHSLKLQIHQIQIHYHLLSPKIQILYHLLNLKIQIHQIQIHQLLLSCNTSNTVPSKIKYKYNVYNPGSTSINFGELLPFSFKISTPQIQFSSMYNSAQIETPEYGGVSQLWRQTVQQYNSSGQKGVNIVYA